MLGLFLHLDSGISPGFLLANFPALIHGGRQMPSKLYVGNLAFGVSNSDLEELFSKAGQVQSVAVIRTSFPVSRGASASSKWQMRRTLPRQYSNSTILSS